MLREIVAVVREGKKAVIDLRNEEVEPLLKAALGLTLSEAENAFAKAIAKDQRLDAADIPLVLAEKRQLIRKSGLLEYYASSESFASIGGLQNLKAWLGQRTAAFTERARQFGLPAPKGLLLLGVQGCGKSLTAKAVASQWHLPLLRLDMGRIFSGLVGSSEENMRKAMRIAESIAPAVLWVDELEKSLAGIGSSGIERQRRHRARVRHLSHLVAGKDRAGVRGGHCQSHRQPAGRAAAQGTFRRNLLHRSAYRHRARPDLHHSPAAFRSQP